MCVSESVSDCTCLCMRVHVTHLDVGLRFVGGAMLSARLCVDMKFAVVTASQRRTRHNQNTAGTRREGRKNE